jgi:Helix-turn-helix
MVAPVHDGFVKRLSEVLTEQGREERGRPKYVADICGVKKQSGQKWLAGISLPTMDHAIQIAEKLGVCVEWLLTGRGPKKPPSHRTVAHMNAFDTLPPDDQVTLQKVTRSFVKSAQLIDWEEGVNPDRRRGAREGR